jgi:inosine-uridine nucleoside N-ribohydrolase
VACAAPGCGGQGDDAAPTAAAPPTTAAGTPAPVVVDTDLGSEDLIALAFLLSSSDADVLAVTVSGTGEVRCPAGLKVVRGLLAELGHEDVPVACGRSTPLAGDHAFPSGWRDAADSGWGLDLPAGTAPATERTAVELLGDVLDREGVTLVTLGPLTNVAEAFRTHPELAQQVSSVIVMGGAVDVPGNVFGESFDSSNAEWNLYVDPTAAAEVAASGAPIVLVGLDATNHAPISGDFLELLRANSHTPAAKLAETLIEGNPSVPTGEAYFWDTLASAVLVDPDLVTTEDATIDVLTEEGPNSGRTLRSAKGHPMTVAVGADGGRFEDLLVRTLDQLRVDEPVVSPPRPVGDAVIRYDGASCRYDGPSSVHPGRMRFTFETNDPRWVGAVAHLTGDLGVEEILEWIEEHPNGNGQPPGIDDVTVVQAGGVAYADVAADDEVVACGSDQGEVVVADTFTVG